MRAVVEIAGAVDSSVCMFSHGVMKPRGAAANCVSNRTETCRSRPPLPPPPIERAGAQAQGESEQNTNTEMTRRLLAPGTSRTCLLLLLLLALRSGGSATSGGAASGRGSSCSGCTTACREKGKTGRVSGTKDPGTQVKHSAVSRAAGSCAGLRLRVCVEPATTQRDQP